MTHWYGIFGKVPQKGDFVARGLPGEVRVALDKWISDGLACRTGDWPDGGIRALVLAGSRLTLILAVKSRDAAGRDFPLVAATDASELSFEMAELWSNALYPHLKAAARGRRSVDNLMARLDTLKTIARNVETGEVAVWTAGEPPLPPGHVSLDALFNSG